MISEKDETKQNRKQGVLTFIPFENVFWEPCQASACTPINFMLFSLKFSVRLKKNAIELLPKAKNLASIFDNFLFIPQLTIKTVVLM